MDINVQEVISVIARNQEQIDLLTSNNTQLLRMLMTNGLQQSTNEMFGNATTVDMHEQHLLNAPKPAKRKRRRKNKTPPEEVAQSDTRAATILSIARDHKGIFEISQFKYLYADSMPKTFIESGIYSLASKMVRDGVLTKLAPGRYKVK